MNLSVVKYYIDYVLFIILIFILHNKVRILKNRAKLLVKNSAYLNKQLHIVKVILLTKF